MWIISLYSFNIRDKRKNRLYTIEILQSYHLHDKIEVMDQIF